MKEWKTYKLRDICSMITDGSHFSPKGLPTGYPMLSVKDMGDYDFDYNDCKYISTEDYVSLVKAGCQPHKGDVLVAKDGNSALDHIFLCKETREEVILSSIAIFRPDIRIVLPEFLDYVLRAPSMHKYLKDNCISGSAIPRVVLKTFKDVPVCLPSLDSQLQIIKILKPIEQKIELNNRINHNLVQQAQALYKSWFVDFEPFKDHKFVESELGLIPEGWCIISFRDFLTPVSKKVPVGLFPEYSVTNNGIIPRSEKFKKQLSGKSSQNKELRKYDIVFGMSREILNWGIMLDEVGSVSSAYNIYDINEDVIHPLYLKYYMEHRSAYFNDLIGTAAREGQSPDKGALMQKYAIIPPSNVLSSFMKNDKIYREQIVTNQSEISSLESLRDSILPQIMCGELSINEIDC